MVRALMLVLVAACGGDARTPASTPRRAIANVAAPVGLAPEIADLFVPGPRQFSRTTIEVVAGRETQRTGSITCEAHDLADVGDGKYARLLCEYPSSPGNRRIEGVLGRTTYGPGALLLGLPNGLHTVAVEESDALDKVADDRASAAPLLPRPPVPGVTRSPAHAAAETAIETAADADADDETAGETEEAHVVSYNGAWCFGRARWRFERRNGEGWLFCVRAGQGLVGGARYLRLRQLEAATTFGDAPARWLMRE